MRKLQLKGKEILAMSGAENSHRLSLRARVSYPTVDRYVNHSEKLTSYGSEILAQILTDGMGKTSEEILAMPLSAFFEIVDVD